MAERPASIGIAAGLVVITTGGLLVYSALTGQGITDVFAGTARKLDPSGGKLTTMLDNATPGSGDFPLLGGTPPVLGSGGLSTYDGVPVCKWIIPHLQFARSHGWTGHVTSGHRSEDEQVQACIHVCGNPQGCPGTCAKPGTSNHQGTAWPKCAVDVTDEANFGRIVKDSPHPGRLINNLPHDRVHYSQSGG